MSMPTEAPQTPPPKYCAICYHVFSEIRQTWFYCHNCKKAFCKEHGRFTGKNNRALCVRCWDDFPATPQTTVANDSGWGF